METDKIIEDLPKALIAWYDFGPDTKVLFISGGRPECDVLPEVLEKKNVRLKRAALSALDGPETGLDGELFDYIVGVGILERSSGPEQLLSALKGLLKNTGKLLIGAENRLAIRYFCGDKDFFSGHVLDGIDNYEKIGEHRIRMNGGRAYSRAELERMLAWAGFLKYKIYAVMPELIRPQILLAEGYMPNESMDVRIFPQYKSPGTIFLEEERLYKTLLENRMFHPMANRFMMECTVGGTLSDADQITVQGDRRRTEAMATLIKSGAWVEKKALYPEGRQKIQVLLDNTEYLRRHKVPVTKACAELDTYKMPYIDGTIATEYFRELLRRDKDAFIGEIEVFRQMILDSSEHVPYEEVNWQQFDPWWKNRKKDDPDIDLWKRRAFGSEEEQRDIGVILKRGYVDLVSINCFHTEQGFVFFDQEFFLENLPANVIMIRTIDFIYRDHPELDLVYAKEELLKRFRLFRHQDIWRATGNKFLTELRNEKELSGYHRLHRREWKTVFANRFRMDYSQEAYERLFTNIFKGTGGKKIYLFGSGNYAREFITQFGRYYEIAGIVDNQESRWGETLLGVKIYNPTVLQGIKDPLKVFVCIKYYGDVLSQLDAMDIQDISVYDPRVDYERPLKVPCQEVGRKPGKYHIGYVAGVFDLFHIGHLNIFRRAKEQCDYLIVGIVSDEQVIKSKKTRPYIPFEERLAIVQACRYVDEAVMIPPDRPNTEDAFYMYHFDAQFSGSDYADNPDWQARKIFLRQHGSDMVFLPYTETTSSTEIKEQISRRIFKDT